MKPVLVILFLISCTSVFVHCQQSVISADQDQIVLIPDTAVSISKVPVQKSKKLNTGLEVGTSFCYSPNNFYGPSYYIAPNISYKVGPRFILHAGLIYEKSTLYPINRTDGISYEVMPMTNTLLYTSGSYLLTPNLTVTGTVYKSINTIPNLSNYQNPYNYNIQGVQLDFQYKVSNSISFGFQVRQQNGTFNGQPFY